MDQSQADCSHLGDPAARRILPRVINRGGGVIARPVTCGPLYHWFGYYDMPVWDATGRYLLSLEVDFQDRPPTADDLATIGMTDLESGAYIRLSQTRAFNWQQGAMLHWLPTDPARSIIFNDRIEGRFVSVVMDVFTGERRMLGRATSDVGLGGKLALGLNFARIATTRPGYGYAGLPDPHREENIPADDGVHAIDLSTGRDWLVASMRDAWEVLGRPEEMLGSKVWFNHTLLNPSETRSVFLMRWVPPGAHTWRTVMFVANPDGSELGLLLDSGRVSHFDWRNDEELLVWALIEPEGEHFYLVDVSTGGHRVVGPELLTRDGHCSYSHNGKWILTDTYPEPDTFLRTLKIYVVDDDREVVVGRYLSPSPFVGEVRCDLHPRWSRDDRQICFDSVHEGTRQVYVVDTPDLG
jgi:hypothetical protein